LETNSTTDSFYSGALTRISRSMPVLACLFAGLSFVFYGWRIALGLALGGIIAYMNFYWLKRIVSRIGERAAETGSSPSRGKIVFLALLRYVLMAAAAYAILSVSPASLYGLFAGLFLPVAAIACEAAYEAYVALARGI
jgi:dipeptide/tripeptide permease